MEKAHKESAHARELWFGVCLEIEEHGKKELEKKDKEIDRLKKELSKAYGMRQSEHEKYLKKLSEVYEVKTELEDAKEKVAALEAKNKKDFTNSSKSSSSNPNHKTIHNSREKSGKSPGGQKGHVHNGRKKKAPTKMIGIPAPSKYAENKEFKPTGKIIRKQLIKVSIVTDVIEYYTPEFRNKKQVKESTQIFRRESLMM